MKIPAFIQKFKSDKKFLYIFLTIILLIIYKIYSWSHTQSTDNAYIDSDISIVSSQVSGNILEVLCIDNQEVKSGQILAKIDDTTYKALAEGARAKSKSEEYQLATTMQKIELENNNLKKAQEIVNFAKTNLDLILTDYKRNVALHKDKYSSQKMLDESKAALEKAKSDLIQVSISLEITKQNLEILYTQKLINQQNLENLKQEQTAAEEALKNTVIVSPIDGVTASSGIRRGNFVRPGTPLVFIVPKQLYLHANFKEIQVVHLIPGQDVEFSVDAISGYKFYGKIRGIYPATGSKFSLIPADNATGNFTKIVQRIPVIIDFDHTQDGVDMIRTGMSVTVYTRF